MFIAPWDLIHNGFHTVQRGTTEHINLEHLFKAPCPRLCLLPRICWFRLLPNHIILWPLSWLIRIRRYFACSVYLLPTLSEFLQLQGHLREWLSLVTVIASFLFSVRPVKGNKKYITEEEICYIQFKLDIANTSFLLLAIKQPCIGYNRSEDSFV